MTRFNQAVEKIGATETEIQESAMTVLQRRIHGALARRRAQAQRGFDMVQLGLVLVIIAIALVGIIVAYNRNSTATQSQQLSSDLMTLIGNVKASYANQYGNVSNANLSSGSFFNNLSSLNNSGGTVTTSLGGGTLTVTPGTINVANDSVKYALTNLPDASCLPLVTALSQTAATVSIGANVVKTATTSVNPAKITCSGNANTLSFQVF
ncbi:MULTISPECIES: type 4 pilus major pilin [unclassified Burkholderia]|uniref:type 4 pilus major pilin n=1 Tax=unclassified Burkholderia TaxID=2613784 RepID=UPI002AB05ACC|nr:MULTISPECIES: type 4 pilus major pilin [unclassified Burkholderia]